MSLSKKVAFITGGGSGIGKAAAKLLAQEGVKTAVMGRTREKLENTVSEIKQNNGEAMVTQGDVSKPEDVKKAVKKIANEWGRLDIVFANAGINGVWAPLEELKPEEWEKTLSINLKGTFLTVKYSLPMLKKNGGSVVVTSSINGNRKFTSFGATAYSCSKAAQVAFTKMTALELAEHDIRINVICPGGIKTKIEQNTSHRDTNEIGKPVEYPEGHIPLTGTRPGTSEDVGRLVVYLASEKARHISGTEIYVDGAESLLQG